MSTTIPWNDDAFVAEVERQSGTPVSACFQCHKCSTGCPVGPEMDLLPSQVMRMVHLGQEAGVLQSQAIWLCASCQACTTRCPMDIDIAAVMDALRMLAIRHATGLPDPRGETFNRSFLNSVRRHGRVFELGMMAFYKLRSGDLFSDAGKVPGMLAKGKLPLWPHRSGGAGQVRQVFDRAKQEDGDCPNFRGGDDVATQNALSRRGNGTVPLGPREQKDEERPQ